MKKVLLLLLLAAAGISLAFAQYTTTDYMYTEGVKTDGSKFYFDVEMKGSDRYYTAFQADIQLPAGLLISTKRGGVPNVEILKDAPTFNDDEGFTEHSISVNFPETDNRTHLRIGGKSDYNYNMVQTSGPLFRVYVEKADAWPIGAIKFYGAKFITDDAKGYAITDREDVVVVNEDETTLPLKVSYAAKWSTCILPFAAEIPTGVTAYTCSDHDEEYIYLEKAESIEAYTPYILYAENGYDGNLSGTVEATIPDKAKTGVVAGGLLNGAIVPQTATKGLVLQNLAEGVKFYSIKDGDSFTIPAGKCWMNIPENNSNVLSFKTDDITEGINRITTPATRLSFGLNGCQQKMDKGVVIKNGKKTLSL